MVSQRTGGFPSAAPSAPASPWGGSDACSPSITRNVNSSAFRSYCRISLVLRAKRRVSVASIGAAAGMSNEIVKMRAPASPERSPSRTRRFVAREGEPAGANAISLAAAEPPTTAMRRSTSFPTDPATTRQAEIRRFLAPTRPHRRQATEARRPLRLRLEMLFVRRSIALSRRDPPGPEPDE